MSSNNVVPEVERLRLAALAELKLLEDVQDRCRQKNNLLQQILKKYDENKENGNLECKTWLDEQIEEIRECNEIVLQKIQHCKDVLGKGNTNGNPTM